MQSPFERLGLPTPFVQSGSGAPANAIRDRAGNYILDRAANYIETRA